VDAGTILDCGAPDSHAFIGDKKSMTTRQVLDLLERYESRNITFIDPAGSWPIVWERARGARVWDADGKEYVDLTAAFGVAAAGHGNPRVVKAGQRQMAKLLHAMGDVHPHALKAELARELSRVTFGRWARPGSKAKGSKLETARTIFCNSGFEAVEAALKTALLATGKRGIIAFAGAYHGLGYGALNATHRKHFRAPFQAQLGRFGCFVPFPVAGGARAENPSLEPPGSRAGSRAARRAARFPGGAGSGLARTESHIRGLLRRGDVGAILVEPIQVRGGINIPAPGFLPLLRQLCDEHGALLVLDEIYTGFGRTGKWFACEHSATVPDILCLGKALAGGFPLSACVGRADIMDAAWPPSTGEAIHTSTFLGHPVGCAMALAQLKEISRRRLVERSAKLGSVLLEKLSSLRAKHSCLACSCRGLGLLAGLEVRAGDGSPATKSALRIIKAMLARGFILLPEGEHANVISFSPPLTISGRQLESALTALADVLAFE
jgi:4-aminobutyrate aminotransferase-like enzyme